MKLAMGWVACGAFAAAVAVPGTASAFVEGRLKSFAEGYGNSNAYGGFTANAHQENTSGTMGIKPPGGGFASVPFLSSRASQSVNTTIKLFGSSGKPLVADLSSEALWRTDGNSGDVHSPKASASLIVIGSTLFSSSGTACDTGKRCLSANKTYERKFIEKDAQFTIWGIPVTVHGEVRGSVGASLNADTTAVKLAGEKWTLDGTANATWNAFGNLTAFFEAGVGFSGFIAGGVDGQINLFSIEIGPTIQSKQSTRLNGDAKYSWINRASIDVASMDGNVGVWGELLFLGKDRKTIVSWDGYTDSWKLWGHSGSRTCAGYRNLPSSECYDVVN